MAALALSIIRCCRGKNAIIAQKSIAGALENSAPNSGFDLLDEMMM